MEITVDNLWVDSKIDGYGSIIFLAINWMTLDSYGQVTIILFNFAISIGW
jgi:hypothetical protein